MDVRCEKCGTEYEFDEDRVGPHGVTVKCTACGHVFKVHRSSEPDSMTATFSPTREWLVRKPDGQMIGFRELTTLQKWIVEGRIGRDDEISKNGETWKRLGNIVELEPFFTVFEKAHQLNSLIDQGQLSVERLELRGSELLSPHGPVVGVSTSRVLDHEGHQKVLPASNDVPLLRSVSSDVPGGDTIEPQGEVTLPNHPPPADLGALVPEVATPSPSPAASPVPTGPSHSEPPTPTAPAAGETSTPKERPTWVRRSGRQEEPSKSDVVVAFQRSRQRHAVVWGGVLFAVAALGGGAALVLHSPEGSWLRSIAGGIGQDGEAEEPGIAAVLERARRESDLDGIANLEKSSQLLKEAQALVPKSPRIMAEHALVLVRYAETLRWWASDLEEDASLGEADLRNSASPGPETKSKVGAPGPRDAERTPASDGGGPTSASGAPALDAGAGHRDSSATRELARAKKEEASAILREAFDLALRAYRADPQAIDAARSLAAYYQVQKTDQAAYEREIIKTKRRLEARGMVDPVVLSIEAAALMDRAGEDRAMLGKATALLEQALTMRPTMNRARVLLARTHMRLLAPEAADRELTLILTTAPTHEEALRLRLRLRQTALATDLESSMAIPAGTKDAGPTSLGAPRTRPAEEPPHTPPSKEREPEAPRAMDAAAPQPTAEAGAPEHGDEKSAVKEQKEQKEQGATNGIAATGTFEEWMATGNRLRRIDRARRAILAYERAMQLKSSAPEPLAGIGWSYMDLEKPQQALDAFQRALKLSNRFAEAYYGLAESHRMLGDAPRAILAYEEYLRRAPPKSGDRKEVERRLEQMKKDRPSPQP